jgi:toxin FitB
VTFLVDAKILSEPTKSAPNLRVITWLQANVREIAVDPIVLGEVRYGIHLVPAGSRKRRLEHWFVQGVQVVRCLPWDAGTGLRWAKLLADLRQGGWTMPIRGSMIAATALVHGLSVVTHNKKDYARIGLKVLDPHTD